MNRVVTSTVSSVVCTIVSRGVTVMSSVVVASVSKF